MNSQASRGALGLSSGLGRKSQFRLVALRAGATLKEDICAMRLRIAKAESERDTWRVSGMQEKYLEAYSMVEALELQLDLLQKAARLGART